MRPDLPWNIAGISGEAREAARAAARREGLSVGEWLTRRIVAGDAIEEPRASNAMPRPAIDLDRPAPERQDAGRQDFARPDFGRSNFGQQEFARQESGRQEAARQSFEPQNFSSDAMLDRVSRSESETADVYRRIEEQMRGMARRLDASERNQTENNRVMSKAAVEMNIAAREQAQAFDQLGNHVAHISERLERVEERDSGEGVRDAVKALHQGLSRLADQISQTASQSAGQISNLADNLENVAGRVGQARHDALTATQALEARLNAFEERVRSLETTNQTNAAAVSKAMDAMEAQRRAAVPLEVVERLEDSVQRLEQRGPDPGLDRRLGSIERTLSDVVDRIEHRDPPASGQPASAFEENFRIVVQRLESLESTQRETAAEMRKAAEKPKPVEEPKPAPAAPPPVQQSAFVPPSGAAFGPLPGYDNTFEPPPFAQELPPFTGQQAVPPFAQPLAQQPGMSAAAFGDAAPNYDLPPVDPAMGQSGLNAAGAFAADAPPAVESYLAAARRSARAAAQMEAERHASIGTLRWGSQTGAATAQEPKRTRPLLVGLVALFAIVVIAGLILSKQFANSGGAGSLLSHTPVTTPAVTPAIKAATDDPAAPVEAGDQKAEEGSAPPDEAAAPAKAAALKQAAAAAKPQIAPMTPPASAKPVPPQQANAQPANGQPPAANAPRDKLTAAALGGNAKAQLVVGLKYLQHDGVPANDGEAFKWIAKSAQAGEPVAQYWLGYLYARGRGTTADAAQAAKWYLSAANQGSLKAMHNLAVAYADGSGVKKDFAEASRWFLRAANLGLADSQFNLAVLYERGLGVPQNLVDAYKWYAIAAAKGDGESKARIAAIGSQLDNEARAAAQQAADSFRPGKAEPRANTAPSVADVTRG